MPQTELGGSTLLDDYDINTPKRIAAFIAQCAHESGGFSVLQENLNYKPQAWGMAMSLLVTAIGFAVVGLFSLLDETTIKLLLTAWKWP